MSEKTTTAADAAQQIRTKRIYDAPEPADGRRVLVDRLWPRGVTKVEAAIDAWPKAVTPSNELRHWYHEQRGKDGKGEPSAEATAEFDARFRAELQSPEARAALDELADEARSGPLTLVSAVREIAGSHVPVIVDELRSRLR